ncbi:hypothetical protein SUGI_0788190 [Cryptomeria japonica]|nr:hypothetical protein SUGI_0788190 [Cryptomeria japonica]
MLLGRGWQTFVDDLSSYHPLDVFTLSPAIFGMYLVRLGGLKMVLGNVLRCPASLKCYGDVDAQKASGHVSVYATPTATACEGSLASLGSPRAVIAGLPQLMEVNKGVQSNDTPHNLHVTENEHSKWKTFSQNAQLVLEKLRRAAEARKILEQDLHKQKLEIEASSWQMLGLEGLDRGASPILDTPSSASGQGLELAACRGPTEEIKIDEINPPILDLKDCGYNSTMGEILVDPLGASNGTEASVRDPGSSTYCTSSTPIDALNAKQTVARGNEINMDPLTPGCTNFEQGSVEAPEGFTMVKYRKTRRKRSLKYSKDSSSRKESLGPEQISEARKKRGRPCSSIAFDASNITNKEE